MRFSHSVSVTINKSFNRTMKIENSLILLTTLFINLSWKISHSLPLITRPLDDEICPRIVSRQEWNARNVTGHQPLWTVPTPYVVIHHGGMLEYCYDQPGCSKIVKSYQDLHIDKNGWIDIGYQFVIGEDGNVYEGRGWDYVGAHSPGYNSQSIGISIIGDFSHFVPNKGALKALDALISCGVALGKISVDYRIIGHRQARDTVCPGEVFYNYVMNMPRWTDTPTPDCMTCPRTPKSSNDIAGEHEVILTNVVKLVQ